jgi:hypothetical protein
MKIKHSVAIEPNDIDVLVEPIIAAALVTYPTPEAQSAAFAAAKVAFGEEANKLLCQAFKIGKKIGKVKADDKDTEMYKV